MTFDRPQQHDFEAHILRVPPTECSKALPRAADTVQCRCRAVRGHLESASGERLPSREIEFLLPAAYGLGGLDLVLQSPEDFGHRNESFSTITDPNGEFRQGFGRRGYHGTCWILPPIGCFPKAPPPPFFLVRVPSVAGEYYAVDTRGGEFKVFSASGQEIALPESKLSELRAKSESSSTDEGRVTVGTLELTFRTP